MKEILKFLRPYWRRLAAAALAMAGSTVCDLLLPTIMSEILNNGVYHSDFAYIAASCGRMLLVALVGFGLVILGSWLSCRVMADFCADLRERIFRKVNSMSFAEYGSLGTAALVTRAVKDVENASWIPSMLSGPIITIPALFLGGVALAMGKDALLSLVMLAFVPVVLGFILLVGRKIRPLWERSEECEDAQNGAMRERLRGIRVIRAFDTEDREHEKVTQVTRTMSKSFVRANVTMETVLPVATLLLNVAVVLAVYLGGWRMENGSDLTGGDILAIVQYLSLASGGVINGAYAIIAFPRVQVAADRISQVLLAEGMADPVERQNLTLSGDIVLDHADFRYPGAEVSALRDVNLHITPGQSVAFIGGTGAGKTTLVNLLLGFYTPTSGEIRLDGVPTTALSRYSMRENISSVMQNAAIYTGTIRENVAMGRQGASDGEILAALEIAQAGEMLSHFDDGLNHPIRQSGKNLSGGQKQRLCIARAVLKDAPIYIFDDCFSALDFLTEARLRQALAAKTAGKTQIIATQRVSAAMQCDCIYVMDAGTVVDWGTHAQLLDRCRVYREIYVSQTGGKNVEEG